MKKGVRIGRIRRLWIEWSFGFIVSIFLGDDKFQDLFIGGSCLDKVEERLLEVVDIKEVWCQGIDVRFYKDIDLNRLG